MKIAVGHGYESLIQNMSVSLCSDRHCEGRHCDDLFIVPYIYVLKYLPRHHHSMADDGTNCPQDPRREPQRVLGQDTMGS
jgi:hypothetical protein